MVLDAASEPVVPSSRRLHSKYKGCGIAFDYRRAEPPVVVDIIKIRVKRNLHGTSRKSG